MLIGPVLPSSNLRLAVHGSAMVWRVCEDKKSRVEEWCVTCRTRQVNLNGLVQNVGEAGTAIRYTPPRGERRNPHTPQYIKNARASCPG